MGSFLRDEFVKNISINQNALLQISSLFDQIEREINLSINNMALQREKVVHISFIIRFDNKGYRFFEFKDVLKCFQEARQVERVIFTLGSLESSSSNRMLGTAVELRLDSKDPKNTTLFISSDNRNFVDACFANMTELIANFKNRNNLIRNRWTQFLVQTLGIVAGFLLSLFVAIKLSPHLQVENPFVFSFILVFIVFSNIWTFLNEHISNLISYAFPNMRFTRRKKDSLHLLLQAVIGSIVFAIMVFFLEKIFFYSGKVLKTFVT